ncbi:MAG: NTP transferase domain-containing protein [Prevotellaceae bacterium]|nr:NTP transferase domain-containing protein [Prevotellaceae bacterium]
MIFAAGLGTRLKPLTDTMPKALVPVAGKPLLQHVLDKLQKNGFNNIVVNVHHFAQQVVDYLSDTDVKISDETAELLETGGALKKALPLFGNDNPVLIHNVDILSNVDLKAFYDEARGNDVTLLVSCRRTQRYLIFNEDMRLVGWTNLATGEVKSPFPEIKALESETKKMNVRLFAFSGIHCVSPSLAKMMQSWPDRFPIMDFYIQSCKELNIKGIVKDDLRLMDVGKLDTISEAEAFINTI